MDPAPYSVVLLKVLDTKDPSLANPGGSFCLSGSPGPSIQKLKRAPKDSAGCNSRATNAATREVLLLMSYSTRRGATSDNHCPQWTQISESDCGH